MTHWPHKWTDLTEHDKAVFFDYLERANERFVERVREVDAMPESEWRRGWLSAAGEYFALIDDVAR